MEEQRLRKSESKVLKKICGSKRKGKDDGENYLMRSSRICTLHKILVVKARRMSWARCVACMKGWKLDF
jgi:hypothetical protein